jgi:hypothetical protein
MPAGAEPLIDSTCPYCRNPMAVTRMGCGRCGIQVEAAFPVSRLAALPLEHQRFVEMFLLADGSLKEIAEQLGVSYPTIRNRLDKVIAALRDQIARSPGGKMTATDKAKLLKDI